MAGRLLDYLGQGLEAARPVAATLVPKITAGGLAFYYATDTNALSILDTVAGVWDSVGGGSGGLADGDYGDITVSSGGTVLTIDSGAVTSSKLAAGVLALFESAGAVTAHEGLPDPHPQYLLTSEGNALYALVSHTHTQADITGLVAALAAKEPSVAAGTVTQYWRGDKTFQTLDKAAVGLDSVDNTSDANKPVSTAQSSAIGLKLDATHAGTGGGAHANVIAGGASGFMIGADKTKLDGIATGATANSADATLLARANHTGTQAAATISDLIEVIQDMLGSSGFIVQGANMNITYDDVANQLVFAATSGGGGGLTYQQLQSAISLGR